MAKTAKRAWTTRKGDKRIAWRVTFVDNNGDEHKVQFPTKREADAFRVKIEAALAGGTYRGAADKITVREVCQMYLEHCEDRFSRNEKMTRKMLVVYRGHVNNHILHSEHGIGRHKLSQLTPKVVGKFRDRLRDAGLTVPTCRKVLGTLQVVVEYAISEDLVAVNAARGVKVIGPRDEGPKEVTPPSKANVATIINVADPGTRLMVLIAAATGLRAGEQWALRWSDIDYDAGELSVRRRIDAYATEGPPKTKAGARSIPLSSHVINALREWQLQSNYSASEDYVFANRRGRHICHDNLIKRRFKPALEQAEVSGVTWHSLRHFAISTWIEAGLTPKTVMTFAGHSSIQVTMDRYGHLFPSDDHQTAMDQIAREVFPS